MSGRTRPGSRARDTNSSPVVDGAGPTGASSARGGFASGRWKPEERPRFACGKGKGCCAASCAHPGHHRRCIGGPSTLVRCDAYFLCASARSACLTGETTMGRLPWEAAHPFAFPDLTILCEGPTANSRLLSCVSILVSVPQVLKLLEC